MTKSIVFSAQSRIVSAFFYAVVVSILPNFVSAFTALFFSIIIVCWFRPPFGKLLERWLEINLFILFLWLVTPWTTPGTPAGPYGIFTKEGIELSALVTIKANALFFVFFTLVSQLSFSQLGAGLKALKISDKLVAILLFCSRGIEIFEFEFTHMKEAAKLRGFVMKADRRTYRTVGAFIALLFMRAFRQSRILEEAMKLRGFNGTFRVLEHEQWRISDTILLCLFVVSAVTFAILGWGFENWNRF